MSDHANAIGFQFWPESMFYCPVCDTKFELPDNCPYDHVIRLENGDVVTIRGWMCDMGASGQMEVFGTLIRRSTAKGIEDCAVRNVIYAITPEREHWACEPATIR
jgi:hypothetical protein